MKEINSFKVEKYNNANYIEIEPGIYKTQESIRKPGTSLIQVSKDVAQMVTGLDGWIEGERGKKTLVYEGTIYYMRKICNEDVVMVDKPSEDIYVTTLSFVQEPELGEGDSADNISQYPLEDILDKFYCYVSDFYKELNKISSQTCYLEFVSKDVEDVKKLRTIIGKHVYNKKNRKRVNLMIE